MNWLQQIPIERVLLWVFLAGVAWARLSSVVKSLRSQGQRIGALASRVAVCETLLNVKPNARTAEGSNGE